MGHSKQGWCFSWAVLLALGMGWVSLSHAQTKPLAIANPSVTYEARVTRVFDGDTLWVQPTLGGRYRKLRLDGLDAPEICQEGGIASRDALAARVLGRVVNVFERSRDDYGRALVRLNHEGADVGALLVSQGHAWAYRWRQSEGVYADQEAQARAQRRGLFSRPDAEVPRAFRKRHGPCPLPERQSR